MTIPGADPTATITREEVMAWLRRHPDSGPAEVVEALARGVAEPHRSRFRDRVKNWAKRAPKESRPAPAPTPPPANSPPPPPSPPPPSTKTPTSSSPSRIDLDGVPRLGSVEGFEWDLQRLAQLEADVQSDVARVALHRQISDVRRELVKARQADERSRGRGEEDWETLSEVERQKLLRTELRGWQVPHLLIALQELALRFPGRMSLILDAAPVDIAALRTLP